MWQTQMEHAASVGYGKILWGEVSLYYLAYFAKCAITS